jgi:fatty acid desaturase
LTLQVDATQNIEGGYFNNWFTGHLNYQVEHHLFPTMPRHRYPEVADRVRALCEKHGLKYRVRGLWQSFVDVVDQLGVIAVVFKQEKSKRKAERAAKRAQASAASSAEASKPIKQQ